MQPKKTLRTLRSVKNTGKSAEELMLADLERSGLDAKDAKKMGCVALTPVQVAGMTNDKFHVSAYMIPYYTTTGAEAKFLRLRFLSEVKLPGENKPIRYWQPPGTMPKAYFPKVGVTKWDKLVKDTSKPIYITEGEKKSACACKHGIPTIGLGGVWSWRSSKFGKQLLEDLEGIEWHGREVVVVFDSDLADNPNVQAALTQMGRVLLERGAVVSSVRLTPLDDGSKAGLDDWLEARGVDAFEELEPEPLSESVELWRLNDEVALIRDSGGIIELESGNVYGKSMFCDVIFANRRFVRVSGEGKLKECSAPDEWLKWPHRREYKTLTYAPGDAAVTKDNALNLWSGWGAEAKKGDVKPFLDVFAYVTQSVDDATRKWLMQWLAYPIQKPGAKMYSSLLLWGLTHGTGKSLLAIMVGKVYGENYAMIGAKDLEGDFNDWAKRKQFVLGEEVTSSDRRADSDRLKFMVTRDEVWINEKYQPKYKLPDVTNYFFTSNHPDAMFVEPTDRRLLVIEAPRAPGPQALYDAADKFHKSKEGVAALLHYLLHDVDLRGFNPLGHAPQTQSKLSMIDLSASDLDLYARGLLHDPASTLMGLGERVKRCDLYTIDELMEAFDPGQMKRTTKIAMAKALRRAGAEPLQLTNLGRSGTKQLYAVRNQDKWKEAEHFERATHYVEAVSYLKREKAEDKSKDRTAPTTPKVTQRGGGTTAKKAKKHVAEVRAAAKGSKSANNALVKAMAAKPVIRKKGK